MALIERKTNIEQATINIERFIDSNKNAVMNGGSSLAFEVTGSIIGDSNGLLAKKLGLRFAGKVGGVVGGVLLQPAVWIITGATPDKVDQGVYGLGVVATIVGSFSLSIAAVCAGVLKGGIDDDIEKRLAEVKRSEKDLHRRFIRPCIHYSSWSGHGLNAMTIATKGGTAWMHPNGLWVYIADAKGKLIINYQPTKAIIVYHPILPLILGSNGRYKWRKN